MLHLSQKQTLLRSLLEGGLRRQIQVGICEAIRKMNWVFQPQGFALRRGIIALLMVQLLIVMAMAVSPQLHEWAHHDAGADDHECAVTLFMYGECDIPAVGPGVAILVEWIFEQLVLPRLVWVDGLFLSRRVLEHAPPVLDRIQ